MITPCAVLEGGERVGRGGRGKPFGKGFPLPPRAPPSPLPKLFIQVHATVSQRPGQPSRSGPPVPWRGCTVEGRAALPCPISVSACASYSGQAAQSAFRKAAGNRLGAGTGRRKRDKGSGQSFRLPRHDGQPPGTANSLDKSCAMVCHKSRKFLFFWAGACGRRRHPSWAKGGTGAFPHSGKNPMGWFGEREKKGRGEGRGRAVTVGRYGIRRQAGMSHRAVAQKAFVFPDLHRNTMPEEGTSGRVRITNASQRLGMSRADGSLHACNDGGPCRRLQKNLS